MAVSLRGTRLAVDIGGTFTDIVLERDGVLHFSKVLTTSSAPEEAVVDGTRRILDDCGARFEDIDVFLHGTTLATNAVIERRGARTGLITTEGFRDVIEIADESRFDQYDVFLTKPAPLVPRHLRFTVPERTDVTGKVQLPLDENAVRQVVAKLRSEEIRSVAIVFLHSYVNPDHEIRVHEILQEMAPEISVTVSSEVCPEAREYERSTTAILNAYVKPLMAGYLERLSSAFVASGYSKAINLMTSGGSLTSLETAKRFPVRLIESGPAGGAILSADIAIQREERHVLSFDMGGTTAKICMIENGQPLKARTFEVDRSARFMKGSGFPLRIPVIEMIEIGAGGGSIAKVDELRRIQVGPQSAGSSPGPASYGLGGTGATVTDADLALGKIEPKRFAGGKIPIHADKAAVALSDTIAEPLGLDVDQAAYGVVEIVDENMANAARVHAIERGLAVGDRTMIAFGGAAPLHACRIAEKLGISKIIIPPGAGVGSAIGFLRAPVAFEVIRSLYMRLEAFDEEQINRLLDDIGEEVIALAQTAAGGRPLKLTRGAFMRYAGQGHEIFVELPSGKLTAAHVGEIRTAFEAEYASLFARHIPDASIEIMNWSVLSSTEPEKAAGAVSTVPPPRVAEPFPNAPRRRLFDQGRKQFVEAVEIERAMMRRGERIPGPAVIVEDGTSTIVSSAFDVFLDDGDALVLIAGDAAK